MGAKFIRECQANYPDPKDLKHTVITNDNLKLLQKFVFEQCDQLDGLKDQILSDPRNCQVDLSNLPACANDVAASGCFTKEQLNAVRSVYDPVIIDNTQIYPDFHPAWKPKTDHGMRGSAEPTLLCRVFRACIICLDRIVQIHGL
jgi:feruloyl esterase